MNLKKDIRNQFLDDSNKYVGYMKMNDFYKGFWRQMILDLFDSQMNPLKQ